MAMFPLSLQKIFIMAINPDFIQFIADQCSGAGEIMFKKIFGYYGIRENINNKKI